MRDLEDLQEKIEEAGGQASASTALNKKREAELVQLRTNYQAQSEEHDRTVADMKKKHHQEVNNLQEQVSCIVGSLENDGFKAGQTALKSSK